MSLQDRIESLKAKHAELDEAISMESRRPAPNSAQVAQMKRQKLRIKDELSSLGHHTAH